MIIEWLLDWFEGALTWVIALFPSDPIDFNTYIGTVAGNLGALNYFLPIAETVAIVVAVFALFPIFLGVTLSLWVVAQLRGSSSIG